MAPLSEQEMQRELDKFKAMQETLQKAYEARMGLIAQQQETELVKQEFDTIEEDAVVYKLVGPVMVKQNVDDAKAVSAARAASKHFSAGQRHQAIGVHLR
ncbi:unnamed protein product [Effrenium voratum]|uniref:Prefoldin subunit 6 n=1 Tax=Effrenium voratum TaxID=2562239 RepID=A0AA36I2C4_9DINO|nr:unnamed protein product [Effrenium voratum]